jgi:hypothetical protein
MRLAAVGLIGVSYAMAQQAVPAAREPHHHTAYEDARVRILDLQIEPRASMLPHRHDADYVWVDDTGIHFSRADINHAERNREVIVELLQPQTGPRNVCAEILAGEYLHCHEPGPEWIGVDLAIHFETDQTRIGILRIEPNATLAIPPADVPPLLIALEGTEAEAVSHANGGPGGSLTRPVTAANVLRSPADQVTEIRNTAKTAARFLVVEFGGPGE